MQKYYSIIADKIKSTSGYLAFKILTGGTITWFTRFTYSASDNGIRTIQYSLNNGLTWTSITSAFSNSASIPTINVQSGDIILFKGDNASYCSPEIEHDYDTTFNRAQFGGTATFEVYGNILSLIDSNNFKHLTSLTQSYTFMGLFYQCNVISAKYLSIPLISKASCANLFGKCTQLVSAPQILPAEINLLDTECYEGMFNGCSSLIEAPELPSTTTSISCYQNMFDGCSSLLNAPTLPATTVGMWSYSNMFADCNNLVTPPALPATTVNKMSYQSMFIRCRNLNKLPVLPAQTMAPGCYEYMFAYCDKIKISTTETGEYINEFIIPSSGIGTDNTVGTVSPALNNMFIGTGGTFTGTPTINTTYYTSNTII